MVKVFKVALSGYDAEKDTNPNHFSLYVDQQTDYILIKEKEAETITISASSHTNIGHGLGYVPLAFVFVEVSAGVWRKVFSTPIDSSGYYFTIDSTNLTIYNGSGSSKRFSYNIFYDNIDGTGATTFDNSGKFVAVAKIGKNVFSNNPNDFVFHSKLNTFKIIKEVSKTVTLIASTSNQSFTEAHGQKFIPVPAAFAKQASIAQVFLPNSDNIDLWGSKLGWTSTGIRFNYITCDDTNITFNFDNGSGSNVDVTIRYFLLERVD